MRIAVIGAGWFGCHIARQLKDNGIDVVVYEKEDDIFKGASRYNTGRLHAGFHYPRSSITRDQCKKGFEKFLNMYGEVCERVDNNLYAVSETGSYLDFGTYLQIFSDSGLVYKVVDPSKYGIVYVEGALLCHELAINPNKARDLFYRKLGVSIRLGKKVDNIQQGKSGISIDGEPFDFCIDCTYYMLDGMSYGNEVVYENVVSLLLEKKPGFPEISFVLMDGPFFSLNKYFIPGWENCYSLYHVEHSVVEKHNNYKDAIRSDAALRKMQWNEQADVKAMLDHIKYYYPAFNEQFEVKGSFLSLRTKLVNNDASRACYVENNGRMISVLSGKIDSVFEAEEKVFSLLNL